MPPKKAKTPAEKKKAAASKKALAKKVGAVVPKGTFADLGGYLGEAAGTAVGGFTGKGAAGGKYGKNWGRDLGKNIAKLVGFGSYSVQRNSLAPRGGQLFEGEQLPSFSGDKTTRVRKVEYICDVLGDSSAWSDIITQPINPANSTLFPWLSRIATCWQKYRFHGLVFFFRSTSSDYTAGTALGAVVMATNYNVNDSPFTDKPTAEASEFCVSGKPSTDLLHPIECDPSLQVTPSLYIRSGVDPSATEDDRLYDMGTFQVALSGTPSAANGASLGELWCSYDVELIETFIPPEDAGAGQSFLWCPTGVDYAHPWGSSLPIRNPPWGDPQSGATVVGDILWINGESPRVLWKPRQIDRDGYISSVPFLDSSLTLVQIVMKLELGDDMVGGVAAGVGVAPPIDDNPLMWDGFADYIGLNGYTWVYDTDHWNITMFLTCIPKWQTPPQIGKKRDLMAGANIFIDEALATAGFQSTMLNIYPVNPRVVDYSSLKALGMDQNANWVASKPWLKQRVAKSHQSDVGPLASQRARMLSAQTPKMESGIPEPAEAQVPAVPVKQPIPKPAVPSWSSKTSPDGQWTIVRNRK